MANMNPFDLSKGSEAGSVRPAIVFISVSFALALVSATSHQVVPRTAAMIRFYCDNHADPH